MNLIYQYVNGAKLFQSGALDIPGTPEKFYYGWEKSNLIPEKEKSKIRNAILKGLTDFEIELLILASIEYQPEIKGSNLEVINIPVEDNFNVAPILRTLEPAISKAVNHINSGKNVLSTCWAGLNRSSLITGLVLHETTQLSGEKIVDLIREKRDPHCLCNQSFYWALI